jgi:hypothetical protein
MLKMLNRSEIVIDIDSFFRAQTAQFVGAAKPHAAPTSYLNDRVNS